MQNTDSDKGLVMANTKKVRIQKAVDQKTRRKNMKLDNDPNTAQVNLNTEILKKAKLALAEMSKALKVTQKDILEILILNTYEALLDYRTNLERKGLSQQAIASILPLIQPQNIKITLIEVGNSHPRSNAFDFPRGFQRAQSDLDSLIESISNTNNTSSPTDTQNTNIPTEPNTEEATTSDPLNQQEIEPLINDQQITANAPPSQPPHFRIIKRKTYTRAVTFRLPASRQKRHNTARHENIANNNDDKSDNDSVIIPTKQ